MLAIAVVKVAAAAVGALWPLTIFPVIQCAGLVVFMVPWLIYCFYLASSCTIKTQQIAFGDDGMTVTTKDFEYSEDQKYAALYLLFCFFWSSEVRVASYACVRCSASFTFVVRASQFIVALGQIVVALAVSKWYFAKKMKDDVPDKDGTRPMSATGVPAVAFAICTALFKHAGSAAFGSLIIAIIK